MEINVSTDLPLIILGALKDRGFAFEFVERIDEHSKLIRGMQTFVYRNESHRLRLSVGDELDSFAVGLEELSTNRYQSMGFHVPPGTDLKLFVAEVIDSSPDLLPVLRSEKSPDNEVDWGDYK